MHKHKCFHIKGKEVSFEEFNALFLQNVMEMAGTDDVSGFELFTLLHMVTNMADSLSGQDSGEKDISSARIGILMRLMMDEKLGIDAPLTPTELSKFQHVSKNTISSLIRGLEDQGLVTRELDQQDKRVFRLKITEAGKKLFVAYIPEKARLMNSMTSTLSQEELQQLIHLLNRLRGSLIEQLHNNGKGRIQNEDSQL